MLRKVFLFIVNLFGYEPPVKVKPMDRGIEAAAQVVTREQSELRRRAEDLGIAVDTMDRPR